MKDEPSWLGLETVLAYHEQLVAEHGGSPIIRDRGLLESALAGPRHRYTCGEADLFVLAMAYASGATRNHPFIDGNKRAAFMAAYTFLGLNGWDLNAPESEVVSMVIGLSDRSISEREFADWLQVSCTRHDSLRRRRIRGLKKAQRRRRRKNRP